MHCWSLGEYEFARSLAIDPGGDRFVLGADWSLRAFASDGSKLWTRNTPGVAWAVNIAGNGRVIVAAYGDGTIRWHRMSDGAELLAFKPLTESFRLGRLDADGPIHLYSGRP